jgi:hypothetical protein
VAPLTDYTGPVSPEFTVPPVTVPATGAATAGPHCAGCCGPLGGNGLIDEELYFRGGTSLPVAGGFFNKVISAGWLVEFGGRSVFYNADDDAAWTADLGLSYTYNDGSRPLQGINFGAGGGGPLVSVATLNRTFGNIALGREYYLRGTAHGEGVRWRAGSDLGMRYGTARLDLHDLAQVSQYDRANKWCYGWFASLHSDIEIPYGCCLFVAGIRAEIDQDYLPQLFAGQKSDLTDVNLLLTLGVRF